jgi:signal transduction histidine kinase/DNA-binding NarL/FixJ family response regulator
MNRETESLKANVLLVDDNESNLLAMESILESPDHNLVRASSGTEALHFMLSNSAAVILLDIHMPGIDGLQTAELIRGRRQSRDVPIILVTAHSSPDNTNLLKGYRLGAVDYITKPIDPIALKSKVGVFVDLYRKNALSRRQADLLEEKNIQLESANLQRLGRLIEVGQQLSTERDPDRLLQRFCDSARDILAARYAVLSILNSDGTQRYSVTSATLSDRETARPVLESAVRSVVAPIEVAGQSLGVLHVSERVDGLEFTQADERLAMTLASQAAIAYENATLYTDLRRYAVDLEREIGERARAEQERLRLLESETAARREAEDALTREQEARSEAEAANRFKDQFLATASHELRTPLNAILGWAKMLHEKRLDPRMADHAAEVIVRNAQAQSRLVDDILDTSRIMAGKVSLKLIPVDFALIVTGVVESLRPLADGKGVDLEVSLGDGAIPVLGDVDRLRQVVVNLLSNGIKFTPSGGKVTVGLQSVKDVAVKDAAELVVTDTGEGIGPEFLPHVFERFRQEDPSTTRAHGGLGLGLSIVRQLVESHNGNVAVSSGGRGQGSTFRVTLPLATAERSEAFNAFESDDRSSTFETPDAPAQEALDLSGVRVLVVEDDPDSRELVCALIEQYYAHVRCAGSAQEALDMFAAWTPQLLLLDIAMAGEDGYSLMRKLKAQVRHDSYFVAIAVTAYASAEDRLRALSSGFRAHLAKPIDHEKLMALLSGLIARGEIVSQPSS